MENHLIFGNPQLLFHLCMTNPFQVSLSIHLPLYINTYKYITQTKLYLYPSCYFSLLLWVYLELLGITWNA